jgi:predicted ATPase
MYQAIEGLSEQRLVTIKGMPGIGKTTLAKSVGKFLDERSYFQDGIIWIGVRAQNLSVTLSQIAHEVTRFKDPEKHNANCSKECLFKQLKDKEMLIILDNIEDPLLREGQDFREFVSTLLTLCPNVRMLCTSRMAIGQLPSVSEKVMMICQLTPP